MPKIISYSKAINTLSLSEKIGQLFMPAAFINDTEEEIQIIEQLIKEQGIGCLCFFHSRASAATNFEGKKKVITNENSLDTLKKLIQRYQKIAKHKLLIAIDAEWGLAMRIENTPQYPYAITMGAVQENNDLIFEVGRNIARDCKDAGIHWNLAPCVDINNNPNNPVIGYRSFGEDKHKVTEKAIAFVKGTESEGVLTSIKHFPGHGDTATDSHLGLPLIAKSKDELIANELYPFQKLINEGVDSIMAGHLSVPALAKESTIPSSISKDIIKGVLRTEMGYEGVVISDALNMFAVSKNYPTKGELEWLAFDAGNDVLCFAEHIPEGIKAILKNASKEQIEESFKRIWELKEKAFRSSNSIKNTPKTDLQPITNSQQVNKKIAKKSLTLLRGNEADITAFRNKNYCTLTVKRSNQNQDAASILKSLETTKIEIEHEKDILILLTPPKVKPANNFGLLQEEIDLINKLMAAKDVVLYLFGNPFVLNHLNYKNSVATVVVYQNFKEFQDVATEHFLGTIEACGKLSVTIKN